MAENVSIFREELTRKIIVGKKHRARFWIHTANQKIKEFGPYDMSSSYTNALVLLQYAEWWYVLNPDDEKHIRNFYRAAVKERSLQPEPLVHNWWNDFVIEFGQWAKKCRNQHLSKTDKRS